MNKKTIKKQYDHKRYLKLIKKGICIDCKKSTQGLGLRCPKCSSKYNRETRIDITKKVLIYNYLTLKLSIYGVAKKLKCSTTCILKRLKKFNIKRRHPTVTKNITVKHHLDLNPKNNKRDNILFLKHGKHQQFHRFAYHYLLKKFGIKEIKKYLIWFRSNYA